MTLWSATDFLESPLFLRLLGIVLVGAGLFGIAKGLFGDMGEGELWWGYVGAGIVSMAFSALPFIFASAEAEMRAVNNEEHQSSRTEDGTAGQHTLH